LVIKGITIKQEIQMQTQILTIDPNNIDDNKIKQAAELIAHGELVAFPTETVYGLGADALNPSASEKIYAAKGRPSDNPLIVHISKFKDLVSIAKEVPASAGKLAEKFWPGPLTMILQKNEKVPYETTGGLDTVAVRMPANSIALCLIEESGCLIAAPSANTSGRPSPTMAAHVAEDLDGKISMIIDGGSVGIGIESTIVDLTESQPMILRPGYITRKMLEEALGEEVLIDPGIIAVENHDDGTAGAKPKAPGMRYRHYAPRAQMIIVEGEPAPVVDTINRLVRSAKSEGKKTGVIAAGETADKYAADYVVNVGTREDEDSIARHLYATLRDFDEREVDIIYSESFDTPRIGQAIMNRLLKAAGHKVITAE
jgi:L-threonylcarbamoyladenylate synthase